ncbi:sodium:calcium antiporter [Halorussus halophilus]|uniref:sodium:calcium antiporter n=1 Tax=Halorussus halophilus TaxID=2650975 RepID=UPI0013011DA1|nr:sodium:calcium antiporter [Halorussus halophilus]
MVSPVLMNVVLAIVGTAVVWKGSGLLESASEQLSAYYGLPAAVQGAIVVAIGSSFPELSSAVISTWLHGDFGLGVAAIVGSATFNLLVIPALSGILADGVEADRTVVYKEAQFYMVAVSVLVITFALAVIYNPVSLDGPASIGGEMTRSLAMIPLCFYGVYIFTQYHDTMDHEAETPPEDINPIRQWAYLAVSLVLIAVAVEMLVLSALGFRDMTGVPSFIWGLTIVAAGTSLPDTLVSVRAAKNDEGVTSLANVLGSNVFDLLVAVPAGIIVAGTAVINFSVAIPMMGFLTVATVVVFAMLRTELHLSARESYILLGLYGLFVTWLVLETLDVTHFVPGA